jgi:hypothetical protein
VLFLTIIKQEKEDEDDTKSLNEKVADQLSNLANDVY